MRSIQKASPLPAPPESGTWTFNFHSDRESDAAKRDSLCFWRCWSARRGAGAQDRPAVVVTPGSARTFKAATQTFPDESVQPKPGRPALFRKSIEDALASSGSSSRSPTPRSSGRRHSGPLDGRHADRVRRLVADRRRRARRRDAARRHRARRRIPGLGRDALHEARAQALPQAPRRDPSMIANGSRTTSWPPSSDCGIAGTEITFVSTRGGDEEIYVMAPRLKVPRPRHRQRLNQRLPSWSPNSKAIILPQCQSHESPSALSLGPAAAQAGTALRAPSRERAAVGVCGACFHAGRGSAGGAGVMSESGSPSEL